MSDSPTTNGPATGGSMVACLDIGTVTARLAVAEVAGGRVVRMLKQSTICDLGEGLTRTGRLSDPAIERVTSCVDGYLDIARRTGARAACCTLTSAARDAANSDVLLGRLAERGLRAEVIPGEVEGSLTFLGVSQDFGDHRIMVADSGGGSTELAVGPKDADARPAVVRSVNVGARRATERFLQRTDPPGADAVDEARSWAREELAAALEQERALDLAPERLVVTGGTATSLVAMRLGLVPYDASRVHLHELDKDEVEDLLGRLASLTEAERAKVPGLQPKRARVIVGGAVVIAALLDASGFDRLTVSESDLLFGLAICAAAARLGQPGPIGWVPTMAELRLGA